MKHFQLWRKHLDDLIHRYIGKAEHSAHFLYFGAAAIGAHDIYAAVAGFMVLLMVIAYITHAGMD